MLDLLTNPAVWASLFAITLIQIALGADNLIIITIIANKLPRAERGTAIRIGLVLAMLFRGRRSPRRSTASRWCSSWAG
jgi:predicted tellurium resistance membrane protein TerC